AHRPEKNIYCYYFCESLVLLLPRPKMLLARHRPLGKTSTNTTVSDRRNIKTNNQKEPPPTTTTTTNKTNNNNRTEGKMKMVETGVGAGDNRSS
ncbi:unnamed protein product, partial [Laminaria digitata]